MKTFAQQEINRIKTKLGDLTLIWKVSSSSGRKKRTYEERNTFVLLYKRLLFDCMQNILSPDFIKATECLVLTKGRWKLTTFERQRNGLAYSYPGVCGKKLCLNNAYSERRGEKPSRVHLNHLFKPFKQTWIFFFIFSPSLGSITE